MGCSMRLGIGLGLGHARRAGASAPPGNWSATSIVDSRSGFASPLPEFDGLAAPEVEDPAAMFVAFEEDATEGSIKFGAPIYLECPLTGTFAGGTLAATGTIGEFSFAVAATLSGSVLSGTVTITNGAHEEVRSFNANPGTDSISIPAGLWVSQAGGNDSNNASGPGAAVQTIDGLPVLFAGDRVYIARGSRWRELLDTDGLNACQVIHYGIGPRPILDACNVIQASAWTKTEGRTNVYQCTVTGENPGGVSFSAIVLQHGWQLEPLADLDAVDAQAGSHVVQNMASGGEKTIFVNLYGAEKAPVDDQMEVSVRPSGFRGTGAVRIEGVMCRAGWFTGGAITIQASGAAIDDAYIDDCVSLHANDHHLLTPGGQVRRTALVGCNSGSNTNASIAIYRNTIHPDAKVVCYELAVLQFPQLPNASSLGAYVAHESGSASWPDVTLERCYSYLARGWSIHHGLVNECLFEQPPASGGTIIGVLTIAGNLTIRNTRLLGAAAGAGYSGTPIQNGPGNLVIENVASWFPSDTLTGAHVMVRGGTVAITNSHFQGGGTGGDVVDDNNNAISCSVSRVSCTRGIRVSVSGSTITPVDFVACTGTAQWRENIAATARQFNTYRSANAYGDCATSTATLPSYETEADANRPIFLEIAASVAARGWDIGPEQTRPGSGVPWITPEIGPAWRSFIDGLSGPAS